MTLDIAGGTVSDVLLAISKQTELALAISADEADLQKTFTLVVTAKPVNEVLEILRSTANLDMEMKSGVLVVRSKGEAAVPAEIENGGVDKEYGADRRRRNRGGHRSWRERFDEQQQFWKKRKKRVELGAPVTVNKDEHLETAVSIGDNTTIAGHIDKDAVSIGGEDVR